MFSNEALAQLDREFRQIEGRYHGLLEQFVVRNRFKTAKAEEHATHGLARRARIITRCISNVFSTLPPSLAEIPTDEQRLDATINIQAALFNTYGCVDNLAWIWVSERDVRDAKGHPLKPLFVGLTTKNQLVRNSFSQSMRDYLSSRDSWFDKFGDMRHALAHRIPLYIPPYQVVTADLPEYSRLDEAMLEAIKRYDVAEYDRLHSEQRKLMKFKPVIAHSFAEGMPPVIFHAQLLVDFKTVEEIALRILAELEQPAP